MPAAPRPVICPIRDELRTQIVSGDYHPHQKLPPESELIGRYEVSRITVRQAWASWKKRGMLFKVAGRGMFVSNPFQDLARLQGFAEAMSKLGQWLFA